MSIEKTLEKNLREGVKLRGGMALKFYCLSFTGMPDRIVLLPKGRLHFVELKDVGKKASARQEVVHKQLMRLGFRVWLVDSRDKLNTFFEYADRE